MHISISSNSIQNHSKSYSPFTLFQSLFQSLFQTLFSYILLAYFNFSSYSSIQTLFSILFSIHSILRCLSGERGVLHRPQCSSSATVPGPCPSPPKVQRKPRKALSPRAWCARPFKVSAYSLAGTALDFKVDDFDDFILKNIQNTSKHIKAPGDCKVEQRK